MSETNHPHAARTTFAIQLRHVLDQHPSLRAEDIQGTTFAWMRLDQIIPKAHGLVSEAEAARPGVTLRTIQYLQKHSKDSRDLESITARLLEEVLRDSKQDKALAPEKARARSASKGSR